MARPSTNGGKQRVGARAWAPDVGGRPAGLLLPEGITDAAGWLRGLVAQWAAAEVAPGRLIPWLPVAFGLGIVGYFTADREPAWWATSMLALAGIAAAILARRRPFGFPLALGLAAFALGLAMATLQTMRIKHPILQNSMASVSLAGFVEIREEREKSDRIVVRVQRFDAPSAAVVPDRVRVNGTKGECTGSRQLRRIQGASVSAAAAVAPRRLRFCARHVFPAHWCFRLRARCCQSEVPTGRGRILVALCNRR